MNIGPIPWAVWSPTVDSKKLEYGPGTSNADAPCSLGFGVGGRSYSTFLASTTKG